MKVFIQFDFEGVAGFVIRDDQDRNIPVVRDSIRRFMKIATAEVSAAANGAFAAGADEVVVWDSHGQGNTILIEELPESVQLITGDYSRGPWLPFFEGTDAGIYIGGHAMHGTPRAVVPHSIIELNGRSYGEVGMFINCCGSIGAPVVLVSGDKAVVEEVKWQLPDSVFVITKEAVGPTLAKTITPSRSCALIYAGAKRGVKRRQKIKPFKLEAPFRFNKKPVTECKSEKGIYVPPGKDLLAAYRNFLKSCCGYSKGWPEYNLKNTKGAV
jgi:D-amino peptidase